jgi:hypothetical protein
MALELAQRGEALALEVVELTAATASPPSSVDERITAAITQANRAHPAKLLSAS